MYATTLFRSDPYLKLCRARVVSVVEDVVCLDQTIFYPTGGGQPGDTGVMRWVGGEAQITDTRKWRIEGEGEDIAHHLASGAMLPTVGQKLK